MANNVTTTNYYQLNKKRLEPKLIISPRAWLKILFARDLMGTEVGFMGVSPINNPLYIEDAKLIKQECTVAYNEFDEEAVSEYMDEMSDTHQPSQYMRLWIHTHPGSSVTPSGTDEETFVKSFGECDYACMIIIGKTNTSYCRLRYNSGPQVDLIIPVEVDWASWVKVATDVDFLTELPTWQEEVRSKVTETKWQNTGVTTYSRKDNGFTGFQAPDGTIKTWDNRLNKFVYSKPALGDLPDQDDTWEHTRRHVIDSEVLEDINIDPPTPQEALWNEAISQKEGESQEDWINRVQNLIDDVDVNESKNDLFGDKDKSIIVINSEKVVEESTQNFSLL